MNNDPTIELWLLRIRSLIADKEMEVAKANRENSMGGWLSDHEAAARAIDAEIEHYAGQIAKYG